MKTIKPIVPALLCVLALLAVPACGVTPLNTRAIEERVLDEGYANRMYDYGNDLYTQGRFPEAHTAFLAAETSAYTRALRDASRVRRIYVEKVIASAEQGKPAPPPPFYEPPPPAPPEEIQVKPLTSDQEKGVAAEMKAAQDQKLRQMYPSYFQPAKPNGTLQEAPLGSAPLSQDQADKK
jgi:hypothetical protein